MSYLAPASGNASVSAVIPMRHNSERVPGKNYRSLGGKPLYQHVVETLLTVPEIDKVVVDTDSPLILEQLAAGFQQVVALERPSHLCDGLIPMNQVLENTVAQLDSKYVLQTHSTNPFVTATTFSRAIQSFLADSEHDSLFSVSRLQARLWDQSGVPLNHEPRVLSRTQDIEPVFIENSCFFVFKRSSFMATGQRVGANPKMFEMNAIESIDIDTEDDWDLASLIAESSIGRLR